MAGKGPFICAACKERVRSTYSRYTERVEYLRVGGGHRLASVTLRELCKGCAERAAETHRNGRDGGQSDGTQERLL